MKKIVMLALVVIFSHGISKSQTNVLKINILSPVVKTFNIQYEAKTSKTSSAQLGFFYTGYSSSGTSFSGIGITPEYRFYLSDTEAPQGVYIAPFLRYQSYTLKDNSGDKGTFSAFGGGLILGKQWLFKEKFALDIFLGPAYYTSTTKVTSGSDTFSTGAFDGFGLRTGVCFGFGF